MKIALAQIKPLLGNIPFNEQKIKAYIQRAYDQKAQIVVFPEMALTGYPPLDLLRHPSFLKKTTKALNNICKNMPTGITALLGTVGPAPLKPAPALKAPTPPITNAVALIENHKKKPHKIKIFSKEYLADYDVFDEQRYFHKGTLKDNHFFYQNRQIQILICEEIWQSPNILLPFQKKPNLILSLNASPFDLLKPEKRLKTAQNWAKKYRCPLVYVNMAGGQEELIFDGGSFVLNSQGQVIHQSSFFKEDFNQTVFLQGSAFEVFPADKVGKKFKNSNKTSISEVALPFSSKTSKTLKVSCAKNISQPKKLSKLEKVTLSLRFGLQEFVQKNGFKKVHIGLSGGLDSAVTATLASQALGAKNVCLFFLPGPWTSPLSKKGAHKISEILNIPLITQSINPLYSFFDQTSLEQSTVFKNLQSCDKDVAHKDITLQNIQARLRCLFLMAYANQNPKSLLLGTANKSELALGYGTLYGDLTGGLLPIGDLFKTEVLALARYFKIPRFIINRPPTAELAPHQKDEDDLPPYKILDPVLKKLIEEEKDPQTVFEKQVFKWMLKNQFKRKQSPPILKIKNRSFDRGWRYPFLR